MLDSDLGVESYRCSLITVYRCTDVMPICNYAMYDHSYKNNNLNAIIVFLHE
jgi:hypothetical protein